MKSIAIIVMASILLLIGMSLFAFNDVDAAHAEAEATHAEGEVAHTEGEAAHTEGDTSHAEDEATHTEAEATHAAESAHTEGEAAHAEEDAADGHGHGEIGIGYLGVEGSQELGEGELEPFVERVKEEAYEKGWYDQIRFIIFGVFFVLVYLSFAKIQAGNISERLRNAIDWYTLGTVSGVILIFLIIPSGIVITFFYMPTTTGAYESVAGMADNTVLAFFRNLHNWSSEIFIFLSLLHAARAVSTKTFLGKRKLIWILGAIGLIVGWIAFLSGTFMRADQEALEGFAHMMYSFTLVPLGNLISTFFSGEYTIMKLTALHVGATIFIIALSLALHVLMRKVHVLVTVHWKNAVIYSSALTLFLVVQSFVMQAPFIRGLASGSTVTGIEVTKPPWPVYFLIQGENWFGANAMVIILAVAFIPLIIFPYVVEFLPLSKTNKAKVGELLFYAGVFLMIAVSYIAAAGEITAHIFM